MLSLGEILKSAPPDWEPASYDNVKYVEKAVDCNSNEFEEVNTKFKRICWDCEITCLRRIQHPSSFGNYLLYKKQLQLTTRNCRKYKPQWKYLYVVNVDMLPTILDYNCDLKRGGFILLPDDFSNFEFCSPCTWCIIVVRTMRIQPKNFLKENAIGWYPAYVIKFQIMKPLVPNASNVQSKPIKVAKVKPQVPPPTTSKSSNVSQPKQIKVPNVPPKLSKSSSVSQPRIEPPVSENVPPTNASKLLSGLQPKKIQAIRVKPLVPKKIPLPTTSKLSNVSQPKIKSSVSENVKMSFLDAILKFAPSYWEPASYDNLKYVGKDVNCSAQEFEEIGYGHFRSFHSDFMITKITTIQHPFAFGNFLLYKQQLETRNNCRYEEELKYLYVEDENMLPTILNYNCDLRRGGFILLHNNFSNFQFSSHYTWCCIVIQTMRMKTENFLKGNASSWYPDFVIKFQIRRSSVPKLIPPPAASKLQPKQLQVATVKPQVPNHAPPSTAFKSSSVSVPTFALYPTTSKSPNVSQPERSSTPKFVPPADSFWDIATAAIANLFGLT